MKSVLLFRKERRYHDEMIAAQHYFEVHTSRMTLPPHSEVIGRYACLPYYHELEEDVRYLQSHLIHSTLQHQYIALSDYIMDIQPFTFPTWTRLVDIPPPLRNTPLVVKGKTNSRKLQWNTHMFAPTHDDLLRITGELINDPLIGPQGVIYRQYQALRSYGTGLNGNPLTNEWRIFYYKGQRFAHGFYWDEPPLEFLHTEDDAIQYADSVIPYISDSELFIAMDVAQKDDGSWIVVELNDGQQSGLQNIDPHVFYAGLRHTIDYYRTNSVSNGDMSPL